MSTDTDAQPAPELVVTADEWIMTALPTHDQKQTGISEIGAWIDAFAIDGSELWCRWMYETLPSDWGASRWRRWPITAPLPAEVAALLPGFTR